MDKTANPAPLGLMGFGMTTVLLNIHNAGFMPLSGMILAMGVFYGGIAQIIAGILEYRRGNTFAVTAFVSYGAFWLTLAALIVGSKCIPGWEATGSFDMGWYLCVWGIFTFFMFLGALKGNRALQFVFFSLTVLFFLLAAGKWADSALLSRIAGWEGIVCGSSAIYLAMAEVLNEKYGRTVLPIGERA